MARYMRWPAILVALSLVAAACTSAAPTGTTPATAGPDNRTNVELVFAGWAVADGDIGKAYQEFAEAYKKIDKRVSKIEFQQTPFVRYHDVLNVQIAGGRSPDIAWIFTALSPSYISGGQLVDIGPSLAKNKDYNFADMNKTLLEPWVNGDKVHAIPFTVVPNVTYYNIDIFQKAGLPTPDQMLASGTWTWANVADVAKKLVDGKHARFGFHFGNNLFANGWRTMEDIWAPYGAMPWSADGKTCQMASPEAVEATSLVHRMMFTDKTHPGPGVEADWFVGDIGMSLLRPSAAVRAEGAKFKWGIAPQPSGPKGYAPALGTNGVAVLKGSKNADIAADFLAFTTNVENSKRMARNFPSARLSLQTTELLSSVNPLLKADQIDKSIIAGLKAPKASFGYRHPNWGPVFSNAQTVVDGQLWKAGADVKKVLENSCAAIKDLLG